MSQSGRRPDAAPPCPWGLEAVDLATLRPEAASTLVPLSYKPPPTDPPPKTPKQTKMPFKSLRTKLMRNSSEDVPQNIWTGRRRGQLPPPGWLNPFGVRTDVTNEPDEDRRGYLAMPSELAPLTATERFPRPDWNAKPPAPPDPSPAVTASALRDTSDAAPDPRSDSRRVYAEGQQSMSLSNFSVAQSSNSAAFYGHSGSALLGQDNTGASWQGSSTNLVHPANRLPTEGATQSTDDGLDGREALHFGLHGLGLSSASTYSAAGEGDTSPGRYASLADDADAGGAYRPSPSALGLSQGKPTALRGPSANLGPSRGLMRAGPSTIHENPDLENEQSLLEVAQTSASQQSLTSQPSLTSQASLRAHDLAVKDVPGLVEKRDAAAAAAGAAQAAQVHKVARAVQNVQSLQMEQQLLGQYRLPASGAFHQGQHSVVVVCESAIDGEQYALKFFASGEAIEAAEKVLAHKELSLVMPPVRHLDAKEHRTVLQGRVMVSRAGRTLEMCLRQDPRSLRISKHLVHMVARMALLLEVLHRNKRTHGNLTPHHVVADTSGGSPAAYTLLDLSCSRSLQEEGYLPWGSFDVRYASPQVVAASLTQTAAPFSAAADLWSLGMILYEVAAGIPYWQGYNHLEVVNCLLGLTRLPHEADDNCLARCAGMKELIRPLLSRDPATRLRIDGIVSSLSKKLTKPLDSSSVHDKDALRYIQMNVHKLERSNSAVSSSSRTSDGGDDAESVHKQLTAVHHITSGQDLQIHIQLWTDVPGRLGCRQLCPMAFDGLGGLPSSAPAGDTGGPVFQFVVGKTYSLSFLVQNRDLASPRRMPFSDVIEVRIGVGAQGDSKHVQPQVRESSQQVWWGEISWLPSTFPSPMCDDTNMTSLESPGTMWVSLLLSVPHMSGPMRVKHSLRFNLNPIGSSVGASVSPAVDLLRNPGMVKREMIRHGVAFGARLGGATLDFLPL